MKTKIIFEITTPDTIEVFPEEGQSEDDFIGKEDELKDFRKNFLKDLHQSVVDDLKEYYSDGCFEENWLDDVEECFIEGYECFDDYGIEIEVSEESENEN